MARDASVRCSGAESAAPLPEALHGVHTMDEGATFHVRYLCPQPLFLLFTFVALRPALRVGDAT